MVLYIVKWSVDNKLAKGKGRASLYEDFLVLSVLCDNRTSALRAFEYWYERVFSRSPHKKHDFSLDDGSISLQRSVIDSRGFIAHYLLLSNMKEPIYLSDISSNALRAHNIF